MAINSSHFENPSTRRAKKTDRAITESCRDLNRLPNLCCSCCKELLYIYFEVVADIHQMRGTIRQCDPQLMLIDHRFGQMEIFITHLHQRNSIVDSINDQGFV